MRTTARQTIYTGDFQQSLWQRQLFAAALRITAPETCFQTPPAGLPSAQPLPFYQYPLSDVLPAEGMQHFQKS